MRGTTALSLLAATVVAAACTSSAGSDGGAARPAGASPSSPAGSSVAVPSRTATGTAATAATTARTVTVLGSGDVLIHPPLWQQAHADALAEGRRGYDFGPMYASVAPDVRAADVATCEMETPLAPPGGPFSGWPDFNAPPQVLRALRGAGYDSCTTASNHTLDQGYTGVRRTLDELDAAGLRHTGSARSAAEAARRLVITTPSGVRVVQLAYAFGFNGIPVPAGQPWLANLIDVPRILRDARAARRAGADVVVVSLHWGIEYDHLATADQRSIARQLLTSGAVDLILGDHAHVVQPAERIDGRWVFYGMGNQISRHADPIAESREGVMPSVTFTETLPHHFVATRAAAIVTWMQDAPALRLIDVHRALASSGLSAAKRTEFAAARSAARRYLAAYGALRAGLVVE
ncbi:MAG: CapA family protein [Jatrophihabitans sp.]|uniref:CapA family protein n=1 Tax=Jatrophihabitans sp. TaxID=1932789 RepID=UPI003F7F76E6